MSNQDYNNTGAEGQTRTNNMVIDLQIKTDKNSPVPNDAASEKVRKGSQGIVEESPFVRTIEHSQIGEGLKNSDVKNAENEDEVVLFDKQDMPHTAGGEIGNGRYR